MGGFAFLLQPPSVAFTTFYTDAMLTPEQLYFHSKPYIAFPTLWSGECFRPHSPPASDRGVAVLMENLLQYSRAREGM